MPNDYEPKKRDAKRVYRWAVERMSAEKKADKNITKDPVGPVKERAKTQATRQMFGVPGGDVYVDWPKDKKKSHPCLDC